jgi:hypothetical protein
MRKRTALICSVLMAASQVLFAQSCTPGSPDIYFNGGSAGIGTSSPIYRFHDMDPASVPGIFL